jgi:hypothetical protein
MGLQLFKGGTILPSRIKTANNKFKCTKDFFFFSVLEFELRAYTLSQSTMHPKPVHHPFFVIGFFETGSCELFARVGFKPHPPDLCLLSS